jgi:tetratricopeptide (TPR) repeat protein
MTPVRTTPHPAARWAWAALVIAAAAVAYLPALRGGFVFDDHVLVAESRLLRGPLWRLWLTTSAPDYWPLTMSALWVQWRLWGSDPAGYHAVTLLLHAATAVLLWRVLLRLAVPGALLAAVLFAVHPASVESVAWISETKNTLSGVLFLGSILAFARYDEERRRGPYAAAIALFALACLAKASAVLLPIVLLGIVFFRRGRVVRRDVLAALPFLAVGLVLGLVTVWFQQRNAMAGGWAPPRGPVQRLGEAAWALVTYQRNAVFPVGLGFVHEPWSIGPGSPLFLLPLLALAAAALLLALRRRSPAARAALWAGGYHALMVLPVLGFVDIAWFSVGPVANHLQYLALMGPAALAGAAIATAVPRERIAAGVAAALGIALGAITFGRAAEFRDDLTLWTAAVRDAPGSAYAHVQLGGALQEAGRSREALEQLLAAARVSREPSERERYLAQWLLRNGRPAEAVAAAREVVRTTRDPEARSDAAWILLQAGQGAEAEPILRALVAEAPNSSDYVYWLAAVLARGGRDGEAVEVLRAWTRERPGHPDVEQALGLLLVRLGRADEALAHAAAALGVPAEDPRARAELARWIAGAGSSRP